MRTLIAAYPKTSTLIEPSYRLITGMNLIGCLHMCLFDAHFFNSTRDGSSVPMQWRIQECEKGGRRCDPTFSSWGRCKPPNGVRGGAPEANAFWQQSIENWLKIRSLGRPRVLNILYCSWDRAHAHATTSRLPPDRENPKAALFCLANRCSRSKMTER